MNPYLIPVNAELIEDVARAIARDRLHRDATETLKESVGAELHSNDQFEETLDRIFEKLWNNTSPTNEKQKESYRSDARTAISAINLKLLISTE